MKTNSTTLIAITAMFLAGSAVSAQTAAISEDEARCFVDGICTIEAEKKFSIAKIDSKAKAPAPQQSYTPAAPTRNLGRAPSKPVRTAERTNLRQPSVVASQRQSLNMRLTFELNSAQLTPEAMTQADIFAKVLKDSSGTGAFVIEGHTDSIGSRPSNLDLSRRRAQSVVAYLTQRGVPQSRLKAVGYGFDRPRDGTTAADPENRRVEIVKN